MTFQTQTVKIDADVILSEAERLLGTDAADFVAEDVEDFLANAPLTDTGNAECFEVKFGNLYRHNKTNDTWLRWDGVVWQTDKAVLNLFKELHPGDNRHKKITLFVSELNEQKLRDLLDGKAEKIVSNEKPTEFIM
jgi:hypothetical protein